MRTNEGSKHKRHAYGGLILRFRWYDKSEGLPRRSLGRALRERKRRSITGLGIIYRLARGVVACLHRRSAPLRSAPRRGDGISHHSSDRACHFCRERSAAYRYSRNAGMQINRRPSQVLESLVVKAILTSLEHGQFQRCMRPVNHAHSI